MKKANQLTQLIWDFWREDTKELQKLAPIAECKVSRWWGVLHIRCLETETALKIVAAESLIEQPAIALRLANKIKIWVNKNLLAAFTIKDRKMSNFERVKHEN
ncbi:MAG: hypothetical protein ACFBSE_21755 [Prochloraceae cyanobacterium]